MRARPLAWLVLALAGCSSSSKGGAPSDTTAAGGTTASGGATASGGSSDAGATATGGSTDAGGSGGAASDVETYTATFGPITVPPSTERTQCIVVRLGNANPIHVGTMHNVLGDTSHHMIVYRVSDTTEQTTPFDCQPVTDVAHCAAVDAMAGETSNGGAAWLMDL